MRLSLAWVTRKKNSNLGQYEFGSRIVTYRSSSPKMNGIVVWKKERKKVRKSNKETSRKKDRKKDRKKESKKETSRKKDRKKESKKEY